jgi:glycosyltransferase involved in cell wall biosynthesis
MRIVLMHQTVAIHDAIGNDIEAMYNILSPKHNCSIFAQHPLNQRLRYIDENELEVALNDETSLIIYHHSGFWEFGDLILSRAKGKIVIRYHNITPPEFFQSYNNFFYSQCCKGREQTIRLAKTLPQAFWLSDSVYNSLDIFNADQNKQSICAPFHKIESWASGIPDETIMKELIYSNDINLLFVGRIAPNKGHLFMLDVLHRYCLNYDTNITLRIIGKADDSFSGYNRMLKDKIERLGLEDYVEYIGEINDATLISYYLGSDVFLCASEHEGFCVPILEAQYFKLPVVARAMCAVPETIGNDQVLLNDDVAEFAAAIHIITTNKRYSEFLRNKGTENYFSRFTNEKIQIVFSKFLKDNLGVEV